MSHSPVIIVNPLGSALRHYTQGLAASLLVEGGPVSIESIDEPSTTGGSRFGWLLRYVRTLISVRRAARERGALVVITWPVLGHLDRLLSRIILGWVDTALVMHDPQPLVRALGYSARARRFARLVTSVELIVHSDAADEALRKDCPELQPTLLPHPVLRRTSTWEASTRAVKGAPVIRVLGQYKPDRDVTTLEAIAERLQGSHQLEIVGRGWPTVDGWVVRDEYVPEAELDQLMQESSAVLIPYRRFFQSGIAIRSLELGTPAVGPEASSIADLYPHDDFLAADCVDSWCAAIEAATAAHRPEILDLINEAQRCCSESWARWRREFSGRTAAG